MHDIGKVSPAFDDVFREAGPDDVREAIVIYAPPVGQNVRLRGRLRLLKERLDFVRQRARAQRHAEARLLASLQRKVGPSRQALFEAQSIGGNALPILTLPLTREGVSALAAHPDVVAAFPNQRIHLIRPQRVEYTGSGVDRRSSYLAWGLKYLEIESIWEITRGALIKVGVLDTGVHGDHAALKGRVKDFIVIDPLGRRVTSTPTFDCASHGTHVCGTIAGGRTDAGVAIGIAPEAELYVAGVLLGEPTLRSLLEGIAWAVEKGVSIINMSLGFSYYEPLFANVFNILVNQYQVLPVVAIGNDNHGNTSSPGSAYSALSVGAIDRTKENDVVAFFSGGASLVFPGEAPAALITKPDVVAPGVEVLSSVPPTQRHDGIHQYALMSGTSMAVPHVSGVAALVMAAKPEAPIEAVIGALKDTAVHPHGNDRRPDNRWGFGAIRPAAALSALE